MNILHIAAIDDNMVSGIRTSAPSLATAQAKLGHQVALLTTGAGQFTDAWPIPIYSHSELRRTGSLKSLPDPFCEPDLVVFHSTYILYHVVISRWLKRAGIPYIVTPRGGMTAAAQRVSRTKKELANVLAFNRFFRGAIGFHCLNTVEAEGSRRWGRPTFVAPNAITLPHGAPTARPGSSNALRFVFLGRLDIHHKGLDLLLKAVHQVKAELESVDAHFELYGPDFKDGRREAHDLINRLGLSSMVTVNDRVTGMEKFNILSRADVFVHTSRLEGWPLSILEAMAIGLPVLATPGTTMDEVISDAGAGWAVGSDTPGIANGLLAVIGERDRLLSMGQAAAQLTKDKFTWDIIAQSTLSSYERLLSS